jgi:ATP-binding cassette subfamily B protein
MSEKTNYKNIARFAWHIWGQQKGKLYITLSGFGLAAFLDTLFPVVTARIIGSLTDAVAGEEGWTSALIIAFALFILLEFVYHTLRNGTLFVYNRFAVRSLRSILDESFAKVQKFSTDWHANAFAGGTVRKITRGMWAFDVFEDNIILSLWMTLIVLITTVVIMTLHWPIMGLLTLVMSLIYVGFSTWAIIKINAPKYRRAANADTAVGAALADSITGNAAVKAFGNERTEEARFNSVTQNWRDVAIHSWNWGVGMDLGRRYIALTMMGSMVGGGIWLWSKGQASAADVVYILTSYLVLSAYLKNIGEQISNLQRAMSEMEDVVGFWMRDDDIADAPDAKNLVAKNGEIRFDLVQFSYANKQDKIYDDLSVTIKPGEKVALVGHSGSGKSTFVKLVQRLYDVQGGVISIDGQDIRTVTQESLRKAIALVPQEPILFHRSIANNIAYGKPEANMEDIIIAAKKAYAHDFIQTLPQGYDTPVGERGIKLSGGERQRVAIARAILTDAPILILDEATSALDSLSEHYIQKAIESLMEGRTTITIAHRLATIKAADRILVFENGRIIEEGRHSDLIHRPDSYYKRLYEMQALGLIGEGD